MLNKVTNVYHIGDKQSD